MNHFFVFSLDVGFLIEVGRKVGFLEFRRVRVNVMVELSEEGVDRVADMFGDGDFLDCYRVARWRAGVGQFFFLVFFFRLLGRPENVRGVSADERFFYFVAELAVATSHGDVHFVGFWGIVDYEGDVS